MVVTMTYRMETEIETAKSENLPNGEEVTLKTNKVTVDDSRCRCGS